MKKILSLLLVAIISVGFASCSKDDKNGSGSASSSITIKSGMSDEEIAKTFEKICDKMVSAINKGNESEINALSDKFNELDRKYPEPDFNEAQVSRVMAAMYKVYEAAVNKGIDPDDIF